MSFGAEVRTVPAERLNHSAIAAVALLGIHRTRKLRFGFEFHYFIKRNHSQSKGEMSQLAMQGLQTILKMIEKLKY